MASTFSDPMKANPRMRSAAARPGFKRLVEAIQGKTKYLLITNTQLWEIRDHRATCQGHQGPPDPAQGHRNLQQMNAKALPKKKRKLHPIMLGPLPTTTMPVLRNARQTLQEIARTPTYDNIPSTTAVLGICINERQNRSKPDVINQIMESA